jgi:putative restriction endonuclease
MPNMAALETDAEVRQRAFQFLDDLRETHGNALPRAVLAQGFDFKGARVPFIGPQGIFKPAVLPSMPLSITTVPVNPRKARPYEDSVAEDGVIHYKYRGTDPSHADNAGLREAMRRQVPLVYFFGLVPGRYYAEYPVFVVGDDPADLSFKVQVDDRRAILNTHEGVAESTTAAIREYLTVVAQKRVHQEEFRARVLRAYRECCAVCRLRHAELLEAAHILPDRHPRGHPVVPNGLSLCKIHHAAFDRNILGIRPDLVVEIREDILEEEDGPMLRHGLQELHGNQLLVVPRAREQKPDPARLEERYEVFRQAG